MLITYPEGRILSRSEISIPGTNLTPQRTTQHGLDKSRLNERPTACTHANPYMPIGDQLELVATLKDKKGKAVRQAEVRALIEGLGIEASYAKHPRQMSGGQLKHPKSKQTQQPDKTFQCLTSTPHSRAERMKVRTPACIWSEPSECLTVTTHPYSRSATVQKSSPTNGATMSMGHDSHGARWIRAALQVNPYSYHGKVSPRNSFASEELYNQALIEEIKRLNIEIIAVTDHWCINSATELIKEAKKNGITALPGFEANSSEGVHILIIFPEETPFDQINAAIGLAGGEPGQESGPGTENANTIINKMTQRGALAIPAHANTENSGLFKLRGKSLENVILNENLTGIATTILNQDDFEQTERQIFTRKGRFKRAHKLAKIYSDDISAPEKLREDSATSWFKITEPSLEAIKTALKSPDTRVRLSEPNKIPIKSIDSITWNAGFFSGATIPFSQELTAIIGGRGTGKSTIIESIRYALNIKPLTPQIEEEHNSLINEVIGLGTTIELKVTGGLTTSRQYTICRTVGDSTTFVRDEDGHITQLAPKDIIEGISIFGQHELSELSRHGTKLADMVLQLRGEDISQFDTSKTIAELAQNLDQIESTERELNQINDKLSSREKLLEIITEYEESNHAQLFQMQNTIKAHSERIISTEEGIIKIFTDHSAYIQNIITNITNKFVSNTSDDSLDDSELTELMHSQSAYINSTVSQISEILSQQLEQCEIEFQAFIAQLDTLKGAWDTSSASKLANLDESIASLQLADINVRRYNTAKSDLTQLNTLEPLKLQILQNLEKLESERSSLLERLAESSERKDKALRKCATEINKKTQKKVVIEVQRKENIDATFRLIDQQLTGQKHKIRAAIEADDFSISSFIDDLRNAYANDDSSGLTSRGITEAQRSNLISNAEFLIRRLEQISPDFSLNIRLNTSQVGEKANFRNLTQLSKGQRATALLLILLTDTKKPLIIDQPEDDLDNRFIYDGVVTQLRKLKGRRQIIASTHNANIPVLGDAELVLTLQASSDHSDLDLESVGSLDLVPVRKSIENILEGGVEAFSSRRRIYGF